MILICGATGDLGGGITHMLLAQGKKVRVLVRPASNYQPLAEAGGGDNRQTSGLEGNCNQINAARPDLSETSWPSPAGPHQLQPSLLYC